jgi:hypothetical protein
MAPQAMAPQAMAMSALLQKCLKWWNPAKLYKKKALKKGREKATRGLDQSPGKQTAQKRRGHKKERGPLRTKP